MLDLTGDIVDLLRAIDRHRVGERQRDSASPTPWRRRCARCRTSTVIRDGDAVVARTDLGRAERVVIAGHLDTVPVTDNLPSAAGRRRRGPRATGRGHLRHEGRRRRAARSRRGRHRARTATSPGSSTTTRRSTPSATASAGSSRNRPDLLAGDFAILMEPTNGRDRGRLPGHAAGRGPHARASAPTPPARWMGEQRHPRRRRRCCSRLDAYEPAEVRRSTACVYREGLNAVRDPRRRRRQRHPRRVRRRPSTTASRRTATRPPRPSAHVREVFDGLRRRGHRHRPGRAARASTCPAAQAFVAAVGGERRARSSAGPTSPASPRWASRRSTSAPATRTSRTRDEEHVPSARSSRAAETPCCAGSLA